MLTCMLVSLWLCRCREKLKSHNAKLVYDVMKFDEKFCCIVLFCVGTAVVCEKSETADLLASTADYRFRVAIPFNNSVLKLYVSGPLFLPVPKWRENVFVHTPTILCKVHGNRQKLREYWKN